MFDAHLSSGYVDLSSVIKVQYAVSLHMDNRHAHPYYRLIRTDRNKSFT